MSIWWTGSSCALLQSWAEAHVFLLLSMILHLFYLVYWLPVAVVCIIRHHMVWWRLEYYICTSNYSFYFFSLVRSGFVTGGHGLGLTWLQREGSPKAAVTKEHKAVDSHSFFFLLSCGWQQKTTSKICMHGMRSSYMPHIGIGSVQTYALWEKKLLWKKVQT